MAKRPVQIPLATKLRVLFGLAVLGIIAAALVVPWYFMELLAEQGVQRPAAVLTQLRLNEYLRDHPVDPDARSDLAALYTSGPDTEAHAGPIFVQIEADGEMPLDSAARQALRAFYRNSDQQLAAIRGTDDDGRVVFRCFRAVRAEPTCMRCHGPSAPLRTQYQPGQLVGMIDMTMPPAVDDPLIWWTRGAFIVGGTLASLLAIITFAILTQRLILRPVRHLRRMTDKVAEGDLTARSTITTGDELQRLGESFNEMLSAISDQHNKLRSANRALDLKLNELAEANVALFQANKVKTEFLANISHELRTPLNSIIGFADLLGDWDDERIRRYGQNVSTAAKNLLSMINDMLDLAKIEAGKAGVRFDKVSVIDTCQTLLALMQPLADKKNLQLTGELDQQLPLIVTDGGKFQQILYNLLSNAVKFTPVGGQVTLIAKGPADPETKAAEEISVAVADTGPGLSEADQQHVFEKFYQADRALTRESSGTGLGLAIAKELTNLLGGRLALDSSPGHGSVFTIFLPLSPEEDEDESPNAQA